MDKEHIEESNKESKYSKVEKLLFFQVILIVVLATTASFLICTGYKKQTNTAVSKYTEIQKADSILKSSVKARELLIHNTIKGNIVTGKELRTFKTMFNNEYTIEIQGTDGENTEDILEDSEYEVVLKKYEEDTFRYIFKEVIE